MYAGGLDGQKVAKAQSVQVVTGEDILILILNVQDLQLHQALARLNSLATLVSPFDVNTNPEIPRPLGYELQPGVYRELGRFFSPFDKRCAANFAKTPTIALNFLYIAQKMGCRVAEEIASLENLIRENAGCDSFSLTDSGEDSDSYIEYGLTLQTTPFGTGPGFEKKPS